MSGFRKGFKLGLTGTVQHSTAKKPQVSFRKQTGSLQKISEIITKTKNCRAFSQSTISKLHDLSFPKGNSINSHIPPENSAVQFDSIYTVIKLIKHFGRHCLMGKCDIEDAFRLVIYSSYRLSC